MRFSLPVILMLLCNLPLQADLVRFFTGNVKDMTPRLHGPALHLAGGGGDHREAMQWMIDEIRGCSDCETTIDVVVLRASGGDGYNQFFAKLQGVDSTETLIIRDRFSSYRKDVVTAVGNAELIFFAGGDQCNYVAFFNGTEVERAVRDVYRRGGGVGGTSAGMAIQGRVIYDACNDASAASWRALQDPYNDEISFTYDFFDWPHMESIYTDTHFAQRDRMGRLVAFLARNIQDEPFSSVLGIGANEATSVVIDNAGRAIVLGRGPAYFVLADHPPESLRPGGPLTFCEVKVWRVRTGESYDLKTRPTTGYYTLSVNDGRMMANPY